MRDSALRKILIAVVAMLLALDASARVDWYAPAIDISQGEHVVGDIDRQADYALVHVRVSGERWAVRWGAESDYCEVTMQIKTDRTDDIYSPQTSLRVERYTSHDKSTLLDIPLSNGIDAHGFNSIKIIYDGFNAKLYVGHNEQHEVGTVPFISGRVSLVADKPVRCESLQLTSHVKPQPRMSGYTREQLLALIKNSADPAQASWEYLDRDTDESKMIVGGDYNIATVRNADGVYEIVYIAGALINTYDWESMMIKGYLKPTIFEGNYDLVWYDADGAEIAGDANASISPDNAILTLRFPEYGSQLRFRRVP